MVYVIDEGFSWRTGTHRVYYFDDGAGDPLPRIQTKSGATMPHKGSELYYETVWASLSDGLKKRILAAVKRSMEATTPDKDDEVFIGALSNEHQSEVDWMVVDENSGKDGAFIVAQSGSGAKARSGIKLSAGMAKYLEHYVVEP